MIIPATGISQQFVLETGRVLGIARDRGRRIGWGTNYYIWLV